MPTGYTAGIESGQITTGKDFLMLCARAFAACMEMRDEPLSVPIPKEFEVSPYYQYMIAETCEKIAKLKMLSQEEILSKIDEEERIEAEQYLRNRRVNQEQEDRYSKIVYEVKKWNPPSPKHAKLKEFALKQIEISRNTCDADKWIEGGIRLKKTPEEWLATKIADAEEDLIFYDEKWKEEIERVKRNNEWLAKLRESLE
jgi:hypothetical protein